MSNVANTKPPSLLDDVTHFIQSWMAHIKQNPALWMLFAALAVMYVPTFYGLLTTGMWTDAENGHGPIIFAVCIWLLCNRWATIQQAHLSSAPIAGWLCFLLAVALYIPSHALDLGYIETASFILALAGVLLIVGGWALLKKLQFPLVFMLFMVPLPNFITSPISHFLKENVSIVSGELLALMDYPVARSGVILQVGQYQLLVADACAGMHTLFMLEALGILYLNLVRHHGIFRNIMLPILIVPISFFSNVVRVLVLALITYYFGNDAGQGFLHGFAGMLLFLVGLFTMMGTDYLLRQLSGKPQLPTQPSMGETK